MLACPAKENKNLAPHGEVDVLKTNCFKYFFQKKKKKVNEVSSMKRLFGIVVGRRGEEGRKRIKRRGGEGRNKKNSCNNTATQWQDSNRHQAKKTNHFDHGGPRAVCRRVVRDLRHVCERSVNCVGSGGDGVSGRDFIAGACPFECLIITPSSGK